MDAKALYQLSYGVYVVTCWDMGRPTGCTANSIMQITSSPATVAVSLNHKNYTNTVVRQTGKFAVSILSEDTDPSIIGRFGFQSGADTNKFDGLDYELKGYQPVVPGCGAYLVCEVIDQMETDTHTVFLAKVVDAEVANPKAVPMTYAYYHNVIKGKSPKNAPTYQPEEEPAKAAEDKRWVCSVCGYIYDGDTPFEELPEDWKCPICKQSKSVFQKK